MLPFVCKMGGASDERGMERGRRWKEGQGHEDCSFLNCCFSVCFYNYIDPTRHSLHFSTSIFVHLICYVNSLLARVCSPLAGSAGQRNVVWERDTTTPPLPLRWTFSNGKDRPVSTPFKAKTATSTHTYMDSLKPEEWKVVPSDHCWLGWCQKSNRWWWSSDSLS